MKRETVEHFLARGGEIKVVPRGVSIYNTKKMSKHITYSKKEQHQKHDPKAGRRKDNEKFYK